MRYLHPRIHTALVIAVVAAACGDGPFARVNPFDPGANLTIEVVALRDTAFRVGEVAVFQLVTNPPKQILLQLWGTDRPDLLTLQGNGFFRVDALPATPVHTRVFVQLGLRADTASVVVMPP